MSGVYLYCVVAGGHRPPVGLRGLEGHPVEGHDVGPFTAWTSSADAAPRLALDRVARHDEVVRAAATLATAVPVRFGAWAADRRDLDARILSSRDVLEAALAATAGKVELGVRVEEVSTQAGPRPTVGVHADGRAYMRALSQVYAERDIRKARQAAITERLQQCLAELPHDSRVSPLEAPGLVSVAHLVAREDEASYRRLVDGFAESPGYDVRVYVTGPWAPYSFATL